MADLRKQVEELLRLSYNRNLDWCAEVADIFPPIARHYLELLEEKRLWDDVRDSLEYAMQSWRQRAEKLLDENAKLRDTEQQAIKYAAWLEERKEWLDEACQTFTQGLGSEDGYFPSLGEPATRKALDLMRRAGVEPIWADALTGGEAVRSDNFSLAKNKAGVYFNDGELVVWVQNKSHLPPDPLLLKAVTAARQAFFGVWEPVTNASKPPNSPKLMRTKGLSSDVPKS